MWCHWWRHYYIMPPPNLPSMYHKERCWERQSPNATKLYVPSSIYFIIKQYIFYRVAYVLYIKLIFWVKSHVMVTSNGVSHFTKRLCWRLKAHKLLRNKGVFFLSCNFDYQLSANVHRFVILSIMCWDTPSATSGLWQYYQWCQVPLAITGQ